MFRSGLYIFMSGPNALHMTPYMFPTCFQVNSHLSKLKVLIPKYYWRFHVHFVSKIFFQVYYHLFSLLL